MNRKMFQKILSAFVVTIAVGAFSNFAAAAEPEKKSDPMQFARGAKAWAANCTRCHNLRDPRELTDRDWEVTIAHMRKLGNIPGNVARDIEAFLKGSN